jgi:DNA (cytosine-5)-methyltransferase 1
MKQLDLFAGIGGFSLAASWFGIQTKQFVEIDPYCQQVLAKNFPNIPIHDDITTYNPRLGEFDIITAGFPCTDLSCANPNGRGLEGERSGLFFEVVRILRAVQPRFLLLENVPNLINRGLDRVLWEIAQSGFDAEWQVISAASMGAPHRRERIFIIAYPMCSRRQKLDFSPVTDRSGFSSGSGDAPTPNTQSTGKIGTDSDQARATKSLISGNTFWQQNPHPERTAYEAKCGFCYLDDGLSEWLARLTDHPIEDILNLIANCFEDFEPYATTNETTREILRILWKAVNSQEICRGGLGNILPISDKEILRYHLHGWGANETSRVHDQKWIAGTSQRDEEVQLREMWRDEKLAYSPQGLQLEKQRGIESTNSLRFLSFETTSPAVAGRKTSQEVLRLWINLPATSQKNVWKTLATIQEIWRSSADEARGESNISPSSSFTTRLDAKRLKALGNSVVPQAVAVAYQRIMELNECQLL